MNIAQESLDAMTLVRTLTVARFFRLLLWDIQLKEAYDKSEHTYVPKVEAQCILYHNVWSHTLLEPREFVLKTAHINCLLNLGSTSIILANDFQTNYSRLKLLLHAKNSCSVKRITCESRETSSSGMSTSSCSATCLIMRLISSWLGAATLIHKHLLRTGSMTYTTLCQFMPSTHIEMDVDGRHLESKVCPLQKLF